MNFNRIQDGAWLKSNYVQNLTFLNVPLGHFRAIVKYFSLATYCISFVFCCLADLKPFTLSHLLDDSILDLSNFQLCFRTGSKCTALAKLQRNVASNLCFCLYEAKHLCLNHCSRLLDDAEYET